MAKAPSIKRILLGTGIALGLIVLGLPWIRMGWHRVRAVVQGKRTVASVVKMLGPKMKQRFGDKLKTWTDGKPLAIIALKHERRLEVWKKQKKGWKRIRDYPFTAFSGTLGPKTKEGDLQIPEGLYRLTFLHPNSQFYLSMKINYPNRHDRRRARQERRRGLGGDIFIHGEAVTIGCVPIGNTAIEELFYLVAQNGRYWKNRVIFAPYDLRKPRPTKLQLPKIKWLNTRYKRIAQAMKPFSQP